MLKEYLENTELLLSETYFKDILSNKDKNIDKYIETNFNKNKDIKLTKTNYHLFYLHYYNYKFNEFLKEIDKEIEKIITNNLIEKIEYKMLQIELQKKLISFKLPYKTLYTEEYFLDI